jgi:thiol-disulfide isomerase/thioredoxin
VLNEFILNGKITKADLKEHFIWFSRNYENYKPNDTAVKAIKPFTNDLSVVVVMGTWCSDSKEHIPAFFKIADAIQLQESNIELIAVDRKKHSPVLDTIAYPIEYVPTFFVFKRGKQIGKIVETPEKSVEKDLLNIISTAK